MSSGNYKLNTDRYGDYPTFLKSKVWKDKVLEKLNEVGWRCEKCNATKRLEIHHHNYNYPWGEEPLWNLSCYCHSCHGQRHGKADTCPTTDDILKLLGEV